MFCSSLDKGSVTKKVQTVAAAPTVVETTVVRLSTEARYHHEAKWKSIVENPAHAARKWLYENVPEGNQRQIRDVWGLQVETSKGGGQALITANVRIVKDFLKPLVALSGRNLWCVEPVRWDFYNVPPCDVQWVKRNKDESGPEHALRVSSLAGNLGIARGWKSLGIRVPKASSSHEKARSRIWKLSGAPRDWGHEVLVPHVEQAGLSKVQLSSRKSFGRFASLFFSPEGSEKLDFLEFTFGDVTITATVLQPVRGSRTCKQVFKDNGALSFSFGDFDGGKNLKPKEPQEPKAARVSFYAGSPPKKKPRVEESLDGDEDAKDASMEVEKPDEGTLEDKKEKAESASASTAEKKKSKKLVPLGMSRVPCARQGNCLFEAIGQALSPEKFKPHLAIRSSIVSHMRRHETHYRPWWDELGPDDKACESWEVYLTKINKNGAYGGCLEVAAAAAHFGCAIYVFGPEILHAEVYNPKGKGNPVCLWYEERHYEWLKGKLPPEVNKDVCNGPLQGGRGGGPSNFDDVSSISGTHMSALPPVCDSACTLGGATQIDAMPPAHAYVGKSLSNDTIGVVFDAASRRFEEFEDDAFVAGNDDGACVPGSSSDKPFVSSVQGATKGNKKVKRTSWSCPFCEWSTNGPFFYNKKKQHIDAWHADRREEACLKSKILCCSR